MVAWTLEGGWEDDRSKYTHLCLLWREETSLGEEEESNKLRIFFWTRLKHNGSFA
jgi:hypothetical protein